MAAKEVSEELIKQAAELMGSSSNFHTALKWGEDYRLAGLNPVYYMDEEERKIFVTTKEKMSGSKFYH